MVQDIVIEVKIEATGGVPALAVAQVIGVVNRALISEAEQDLHDLFIEGVIAPEQRDASAQRLRMSKPNALVLTEAHTGSIVLIGLAAGVSYWVLNQTLSESLKEAWTQSDLHKRIVAWLSRRWSRGPHRTVEAIERQAVLGEEQLARKYDVELRTDTDDQGRDVITLGLKLRPDDDYAVPRSALPLPGNEGPAADLEVIAEQVKAHASRPASREQERERS